MNTSVLCYSEMEGSFRSDLSGELLVGARRRFSCGLILFDLAGFNDGRDYAPRKMGYQPSLQSICRRQFLTFKLENGPETCGLI